MKRLIVSIMMLVFMGSLAFATPDTAFVPYLYPNGFQGVGVSTSMVGMGDHVFNLRSWANGNHKVGEKIYLVGTIVGSRQIGTATADGNKPVYGFAIYTTGWDGSEFTQGEVWFYSEEYWRPKVGWLVGFFGEYIWNTKKSDGTIVPVFNTFGAQWGMQPVSMAPVILN
jgi:hypothetical protein